MTKEERKYRKEVIIPEEIKRLQNIIDAKYGYNLHIKQLKFEHNISQKTRTICLVFKEKFTRYKEDGTTEKINKRAQVMKVHTPKGISKGMISKSFTGCVTVWEILENSGTLYTQYHNGERTEEYDNEIKDICIMLANEYYIWLDYADFNVWNFVDYYYLCIQDGMCGEEEIRKAEIYAVDALYARWKRLNLVFDNEYSVYNLNQCIENYNEQVQKGLIYDSPFSDGKFPIVKVEERKLKNRETIYTMFG